MYPLPSKQFLLNLSIKVNKMLHAETGKKAKCD